ncbi:MAG TPA: outer membrane beta-barrel family protein, partial [Chitinophagaceae bacterium]|nr:outer membrane beta-barrel family protein [Chitinophagaceae bacterium]
SEYLKTIQSGDIESIEIISNPSAKYDAAGNAGIINIKMKKNKNFGTNGTVTGGFNQGFYSKYNAGFSINHRNKHVNLFGNYNYNNSIDRSYIDLQRTQLDSFFDQHTVIRNNNNSHTFKAGVDYFLNKRSTIGMMVNGTLADNTFHSDGNTMISYIPTGVANRKLVANNVNDGKRNNGNLNLNYRYADTSGHELNMDADYGIYRIKSNQLQPNQYFDPSGTIPLYSNVYNMLAPNNIDIYSFKTDYEQGFKKGKLGLGFKTSYVKSDNTFTQYNVYPNSKLYDSSHSNSFNYRENINAGYINYNRALKGGWAIQAGLRVENTNVKGTSNGYRQGAGTYAPYDSVFDRHYTDFFPSGAVTYNKNPMKQWSLTYSRRIDRPAYQDMNPFELKLDEYTFQKGNTGLRPQYTNSVGLTYMYKFRLTTTLNYSHVKDVFTQLVDTTEKSKAFITKKNLATQDITSLNISYPFQYKWYSVFANINTYYSAYKANFGTGRTVNVSVFSLNAYAQQSFKLGKGWTGEITGFYTAPSVWQGTFKTKTIWSVDAGLSKTVLKGKGTVKGSVSDVFNTLHWDARSEFAGQIVHAKGGYESRQLKLYFTYRFGSNTVKAARQRKLGSEEESKRVGTQGGGLGN